MARVIHATTMKPTIANPCLVTGSSGNGANHTATGTRMQRICPTMTTGVLGFSSKFSADADAEAVSAATMGYSVVRHWGCTLPAPRRQARQRCILSGQRLPGQRSREAQRLIELVRVHLVDPCV